MTIADMKVGHAYRIAGRWPVVVTRFDIGFKKGGRFTLLKIEGFTPGRWRTQDKFYTIDENDPYGRTIAEVEGIEPPPMTRFKCRIGSKIEEVAL